MHETRFEHADLKKEGAQDRLEANQEKETQLQSDLEANSEQLNTVMQNLAEARAELNNTDSAHKVKALENSIDAKQHELNVVKEKIQNVYSLLRSTVTFSNFQQFLPSSFIPVVQESVALWRSGEDMMAEAWPLEPVNVDNNLEKLKGSIDEVRREISRRFEASVIRMNELRTEIQNQRSAVEQLKEGRAPLRRNTRELMQLLGITALSPPRSVSWWISTMRNGALPSRVSWAHAVKR
ncbi:hypothetical protein [Aliamphritea spongicola]|nr:hypothetical protein [Aliamphritea spongicola]